MTSLLAGGLAKTIAGAMKNLFLDATLTRFVPASTGSAYDPDPPVSTDYACKAIFDQWGAYHQANGLVLNTDRKVLVLANTLAVEPMPGDRIAIGGVTLNVYSNGEGAPAVATDPAKAVWTLRART